MSTISGTPSPENAQIAHPEAILYIPIQGYVEYATIEEYISREVEPLAKLCDSLNAKLKTQALNVFSNGDLQLGIAVNHIGLTRMALANIGIKLVRVMGELFAHTQNSWAPVSLQSVQDRQLMEEFVRHTPKASLLQMVAITRDIKRKHGYYPFRIQLGMNNRTHRRY